MPKFPPPPPQILPRQLKQTYLSFSQESLWFLQQLDPDNYSYNSNYLVKFTGGIDRHFLTQALNELVRRHEPLRTIYPNEAGRPIQVIQPFELVSIPFEDYSGLPGNEAEQAIHCYTSKISAQPLDLQRGPLTRFAILHTSSNVDYLFFCTHHIGFDAWSRQVFFSELVQLYNSFRSGEEPDLPELLIQYADYAAWQRDWLSGETFDAYIAHWKNILSGELPALELPTDRPRPALQSFRGARYHFEISQTLYSQIKDLCQKQHLTPFQLLLAAYAILLMRYTGQEDIIVGCPFANRSRPELDGIVGMFVNTLPVRVNLSGNPDVRNFLERVRALMQNIYPWQAAPFEALVSEISPQRDLGRTPIFNVTINMKNVPKRQAFIPGLEMENILLENAPSPFDISLEFDIKLDGGLDGSLQYNIDLYDETTIINMASHYQALLGELLRKTECSISELDMLLPSERQRLVVDWNNTGTDFPQVCIQDLIQRQAIENPEALAVVCNGNSITYGELEKKASQLAQYLRKIGVRADDRVGLFLPRSETLIISQLAILKAGCAFIPVDLTYPVERIAFIMQDSQPAAVITLSHLSNQLPNQYRKICLDTETRSIEACDSQILIPATNNESIAYVIYTSGSTGRPKGAMNTQKGVVNYLASMTKQFQFTASERVVQFTSISFDPSVWSILGTLSYGGTVYLLDDDQMRDPASIYKSIIDHQATYVDLVPTMLRAVCEYALTDGHNKNSLRIITVGGEVLWEMDMNLAQQVFGDSVQLVNQYGPTECSIWATNYAIPPRLPNGLQAVPIGKPIQNVRTYVLDNYFHFVPQGAKGELFIGGVGVGKGYWNQPDLTDERFLDDPFWAGGHMYRSGDIVRQLADGTICFLGRTDFQVKIRGYRVELSEIEAILSEFHGVKDTAVALWKNDGQENLAAYITLLEGQPELILADLRNYISSRLPFYMLPASITILKDMPLTPSRKIDRNGLPRPDFRDAEERFLAPRNEVEARLVSIWKEVMGINRIGIRDNFFELGGHSLLAVRLFARIREEFGRSLPLLLMFKDGTVEALAKSLTQPEKTPITDGVVTIQPHGNGVPLFIISANLYMREFALAMGTARPVYSLHPFEDGQLVYRKSVQETARICCQTLIEFYPEGPYLLFGHSAYGYLALELARQLGEIGKKVAILGLLDTYPPGWKHQVAFIDRVKVHSNNLQHKNLMQILQYAGLSAGRFLTRWRRRAAMNAKSLEHYEEKGQVDEIRTILLSAYKPEPYRGRVTLFSATDRPFYIRRNIMELWAGTFTGQFNVIPTSGTHTTMLQPPHVAILAKKIRELLSQIDKA